MHAFIHWLACLFAFLCAAHCLLTLPCLALTPSFDSTSISSHSRWHACPNQIKSDLDEDEWKQYGYYKRDIGVGEEGSFSDYILRIHENDTSREHFQRTFEATRTPVMIDGIVQRWPAWTQWSLENILKQYGNSRMKCGEDDDGHSIRLRVWKYLEYMKHQTDDSPVYLFEGCFDEDKKCCKLLEQ